MYAIPRVRAARSAPAQGEPGALSGPTLRSVARPARYRRAPPARRPPEGCNAGGRPVKDGVMPLGLLPRHGSVPFEVRGDGEPPVELDLAK